MRHVRNATALLLLLILCPGVVGAGGGPLKLVTAKPSCPDNSSDIYVGCGNGTVTDNRTGLVWLRDANCLGAAVNWQTAVQFVAGLADQPEGSVAAGHDCGLSDGSSPGEWRLATVDEWLAMTQAARAIGCYEIGRPVFTDDTGTVCWEEGSGSSFINVRDGGYWTPSTSVLDPTEAWAYGLAAFGSGPGRFDKTLPGYVWPVRGGQ